LTVNSYVLSLSSLLLRAAASDRFGRRRMLIASPAFERLILMLWRCSPVIGPEFIKPCLPCAATLPPTREAWLHEIKHPGHRMIACRGKQGIRLLGGPEEDWTSAFPLSVESMNLLPIKSCIDDDLMSTEALG
jgi:ATP-dependent DNA ligase